MSQFICFSNRRNSDSESTRKKKMKSILENIDRIHIGVSPASHESRDLPVEPQPFDLNYIPDDMLPRTTISVESNFDIAAIAMQLSHGSYGEKYDCMSDDHSEFIDSLNLWKYPPHESQLDLQSWVPSPLLKISDVIDSMWNLDKTKTFRVGKDCNSDSGILARMAQWQGAVGSLTVNFFRRKMTRFYIRGTSVNALRAVFYFRDPSLTQCECILHGCPTQLYKKMRDIGIRMFVLEDRGLASDEHKYYIRDKKGVSDVPLLIQGEVDVRAAIDCVAAVCLSLDSVSSYSRSAMELPYLLSPYKFMHAVPAQSSSLTSFTNMLLFNTGKIRMNADSAHPHICKISVPGPLNSICIVRIANLLRQLARDIESHAHSSNRKISSFSFLHVLGNASEVHAEDIDFTVEESRATAISKSGVESRFSDLDGMLNPFRLVVSDPVEIMAGSLESLELPGHTVPVASAKSLGADADNYGPLNFIIKSNVSVHDFDFAYASDGHYRKLSNFDSIESRKSLEGLVVTNVLWTADMLDGEFNVQTVRLPCRRIVRASSYYTCDESSEKHNVLSSIEEMG